MSFDAMIRSEWSSIIFDLTISGNADALLRLRQRVRSPGPAQGIWGNEQAPRIHQDETPLSCLGSLSIIFLLSIIETIEASKP